MFCGICSLDVFNTYRAVFCDVDKMKCIPSNESYRKVVPCGTVYNALKMFLTARIKHLVSEHAIKCGLFAVNSSQVEISRKFVKPVCWFFKC